MDSTILLLIIFADGREKIISGVRATDTTGRTSTFSGSRRTAENHSFRSLKCDISEAHLIMRMRLERCKL